MNTVKNIQNRIRNRYRVHRERPTYQIINETLINARLNAVLILESAQSYRFDAVPKYNRERWRKMDPPWDNI